MRLKHGIDLGYCTNIHRGETWEETFAGLKEYTLRVKERVCPEGERYGIGLRLGADAAMELGRTSALGEFRRWLDANDCYVFTINGFPYGKFHGTRVKEQVYRPDWTGPNRPASKVNSSQSRSLLPQQLTCQQFAQRLTLRLGRSDPPKPSPNEVQEGLSFCFPCTRLPTSRLQSASRRRPTGEPRRASVSS